MYIYGDSHTDHSFRNLNINNSNYNESSVTMYRIGRDNKIINFNDSFHDENSIICLSYGEIDCRCHIQKQINIGRNEDEIINELVTKYFETVKNIIKYKKIIIVGIIPPTRKVEYEKINGQITHEFPFIGNDKDRVRFTNKVNRLLEKFCKENSYIYFNPYSYYTRNDGTLIYKLSDNCVHIGDNEFFKTKFTELYETL